MVRDFQKNPVTDEERHNCYWYAVVDDLIGGYNVSNVNKPASQANVHENEFEIGCFMTKETAQHIVELHNAWWDAIIWESYADNIMATYDRELREFYFEEVEHNRIKPLTEDEWFDYDPPYEEA